MVRKPWIGRLERYYAGDVIQPAGPRALHMRAKSETHE